MNSPTAPGSSDAHASITDEAIAWLAERDEGFSPARKREFARWLRADPTHAATVARLEKSIELLNHLPDFRAELNAEFHRSAPILEFQPERRQERSTPLTSRRRSLLAVAIAALVMLAIGGNWFLQNRPIETRYATTVAGYARARLEDGSTLELNSVSEARVQFTQAQRRVQLDAGEAFFQVAHDTARPFFVNARGVLVRAVGTAFNVRVGEDGNVTVTVTEGQVRVESGSSPKAGMPISPLVSAGERLILDKQSSNLTAEKIPPELLRETLAWQSSLAKFADEPLSAVVARFNARNRVHIRIHDAELAARPIGGTFALDQPEAFVRLLERGGEIVVERPSEDQVVLRRAR